MIERDISILNSKKKKKKGMNWLIYAQSISTLKDTQPQRKKHIQYMHKNKA